jgi:hypothetical protein
MNQYNWVYEAARNSLIPEAKKYATKVSGARPAKNNVVKYELWCDKWNLAFHSKMNTLWEEKS